MKNVVLIAGLAVLGYAWYRDTHRAGGGTDMSTVNQPVGSPGYSGGVTGTSGGGAQGLSGSSGGVSINPSAGAGPAASGASAPVLGMQGRMTIMPVLPNQASPDALAGNMWGGTHLSFA